MAIYCFFPRNSPRRIFDGVSILRRIFTVLACLMVLAGCATTQTTLSFEPRSINEVRFRDRSQSKYDDEVRVTVAVPTADENKAVYAQLSGKKSHSHIQTY